jgi:GNAT superfamily N-acetyltransferase
MVECRPVSSRRELDEWIALTDRVYAGTTQFVPPLRKQLRDLHAGKAPHLRSGTIEFLSVVRDGAVVARTTAHTNTKLDAKLGALQLLFGFTELLDDDEAFAALVSALEERARRLGAAQLLGPVNLLPNQSGGVIVSGFDERGFVDSPYNHPYYPALYERHGFERVFEGETFLLPGLDRSAGLPPFDAERLEREGLELRSVNRRRVEDELVELRRMLNESFAQRAYYTEIDEDELAYQVDGLGYLLDERIALFLLKRGKPIGFVLCIPDISPFVSAVNGDLGPLNQVRLLLTRGRYRSEAICVIQGIVPAEQGKGYLRLLFGQLLRNLREAGYHTLRGTFVEHENAASSSYADRIGRPLHGVTFYRRAVG